MHQSLLFDIEIALEIIGFGEFIGKIVLHVGDFLLGLLHFLGDTAFKILDFLEIILNLLFLYSKSGSGSLGILKLSLLKFEIALHFVHLF